MTYTPKVGDRVRLHDWSRSIVVEYVGREWLIGHWQADGREIVLSRDHDWLKVEPRPKLAREQWGWINGAGLYFGGSTEAAARRTVAEDVAEGGLSSTLACIIGGRVCDEFGRPLDVEDE